MDWLNLLVLALVQGITEFLPISSSAHLILVTRLFGWQDQGLAIDVATHFGTLLAVMVYFRAEVGRLVTGGVNLLTGRADGDTRLLLQIIVATIPLLVVLFLVINRHYRNVADGLSIAHLKVTDLQEVAEVALVPIADIHRGTLRAIRYAASLCKEVRVISIVSNQEQRERIERRWKRFPEVTGNARLVLIDYDYRDVFTPLLTYVEHVNNVEFPNELITVVVPEFVPESPLARALHNQTARFLEARLRKYEDIALVHVPHFL